MYFFIWFRSEKYSFSVLTVGGYMSMCVFARFQFVACNFCNDPTASHGDGDEDDVLYALAATQSML
jgi:hypothetical protein